MKQISVNNGNTYIPPSEALMLVDLGTIAAYMDDETREAVHMEYAPCGDIEFLRRYLEAAPDNLIVG